MKKHITYNEDFGKINHVLTRLNYTFWQTEMFVAMESAGIVLNYSVPCSSFGKIFGVLFVKIKLELYRCAAMITVSYFSKELLIESMGSYSYS